MRRDAKGGFGYHNILVVVTFRVVFYVNSTLMLTCLNRHKSGQYAKMYLVRGMMQTIPTK